MGLFSECKQMVKYSGTNIEIGTVKGPIQVPVEVAGIKIKPELLQTAGNILLILDWLQFTACQRIHQLKKLRISSERIADLILKQDEDAHMIAAITVLSMAPIKSARNFERVLADWIAAAIPRAQTKRTPDNKTIEAKRRFDELGEELNHVEKEIHDLTRRTEQLKHKKEDLESSIKSQREIFQLQMEQEGTEYERKWNEMYYEKIPSITGQLLCKIKLEDAISAFPYLSEALKKEEPFDIRRSLKLLAEDQ